MIKLRVTADKLNIRNSPDVVLKEKNYVGHLLKDTVLYAEKRVKGELYRNNDLWYKDQYNRYVWSGGVDEVVDLGTTRGIGISFPEAVDWKKNFLGMPDELIRIDASGINIAIIDSGIENKHPNLATANISSFDFTQITTDGRDDMGHGSAVAGIIGGKFFEGKGFNGIASGAKIISGKIFSSKDSIVEDDEATMIRALDHMINLPEPIHVLNLSLSCPESQGITDRLTQLSQRGTIIVAAAFNQRGWDRVFFPAKLPFCISVASMNEANMHNTPTEQLEKADVIGPYLLSNACSIETDGFFKERIGCSFTTAYISGCIALILAKLFSSGVDPASITKQLVFPLLKKTASTLEETRLFNPSYFGFITKK